MTARAKLEANDRREELFAAAEIERYVAARLEVSPESKPPHAGFPVRLEPAIPRDEIRAEVGGQEVGRIVGIAPPQSEKDVRELAKSILAELYKIFDDEAEYRDLILWTPTNPRKEVRGLTKNDIENFFATSRVFSPAIDLLERRLAQAPSPSAEVADIVALIDKAHDKVVGLCHGERWTMHIPADPRNDPDLVIGEALRRAKAALLFLPPSTEAKP
jgi:hypothetical protein